MPEPIYSLGRCIGEIRSSCVASSTTSELHRKYQSVNTVVERMPRNTVSVKRKVDHLEEKATNGKLSTDISDTANKKLKVEPMCDTFSTEEIPSQRHFVWKKIQARDGLDCDYTMLFDKDEADTVFSKLEKKITYLSGDLSKLKVYGKWHNIPRKRIAYGDAGLTYTYSGVTLTPKPWIRELEYIRDRVTQATGHSFNFVLINRYKDGSDHIGEHKDDQKELVPHSPIASVSLGACRDFFFRHGASRGKNSTLHIEPVKLQLAHGSLLMMNYPTNVHWYHSLPARKKILEPRINLTFRKVLALK